MNTTYVPKKLKETLNYLGPFYSMKIIDLEKCGYRNLGDGFDLEISGLSDKKKKLNCSVYLWKMDRGYIIIHHTHNISSLEKLQEILTDYAINKRQYLESFNQQMRKECGYQAVML